jgi:Holliday junction resolvasome RuvABC endonuclease subunit
MNYIGFDQSSKVIGYCAITGNGQLLTQGVYKIPNADNLNLMQRIEAIEEFIIKMYNEYKDKEGAIIGIEDTQESRMNVNTFQLLTKVLGAIEYFLYKHKITYMVCHVSSWRGYAGVKGKKREDKKKNAIKIAKEKFGTEMEEDAAEAALITLYLKSQQNAW